MTSNIIVENNASLRLVNSRVDIRGDVIVKDGGTISFENINTVMINGKLIVHPKGTVKLIDSYIDISQNAYIYNSNSIVREGRSELNPEALFIDKENSGNYPLITIPLSKLPDVKISGVEVSEDDTTAKITAIHNSDFYDFTDKLIWSVESNGNPVELYSDESCQTRIDGEPTDITTVYVKGEGSLDCVVKATSYYYDYKNASCKIIL